MFVHANPQYGAYRNPEDDTGHREHDCSHVVQIAGVVVNFVFDPILIFGIGIFPAMGIRGAAVATVAGYLLSMILAFALLLDKKQKVQIKIKGFHLQKQMIRRIFAFGLPSFIMNALSSFMVTFVNLFLVAYSDTAIAFFGAYFKVLAVDCYDGKWLNPGLFASHAV